MIDQSFADFAPPDDHLRQARWDASESGGGAVEDCLDGEGRERGLFRWLPHDGIAADQSQGGVPCPNGDGEIECGNDADGSQWMPRLAHVMERALAHRGQAIELARKASGEIADINHFLDFAESFGNDFAGFERDQTAEFGLGLAQFLAEQSNEFAPARRGNGSPN